MQFLYYIILRFVSLLNIHLQTCKSQSLSSFFLPYPCLSSPTTFPILHLLIPTSHFSSQRKGTVKVVGPTYFISLTLISLMNQTRWVCSFSLSLAGISNKISHSKHSVCFCLLQFVCYSTLFYITCVYLIFLNIPLAILPSHP